MNPNAFLLTLVLTFFSVLVSGQEVRFSSGVQFGTYAMKDLLAFQADIVDPEFLGAKETGGIL